MQRRHSSRRGTVSRVVATVLAAAAPAAAQETVDTAPPKQTELGKAVDEIVVWGDRNKGVPVVRLKEGGAHDVIGPDRIADIAPWSVEEVLNRLPGINSRLYSGDENLRPSIAARGAPDDGFTEFVGVHVDGINYSTLFYGWTALSIFPFTPERIYAAEVYRGAHAIRFGPTTLGGVVNLITRPIPSRWEVGERMVLGSNSFFSSTFDVGGTDEKTGFGFLLTRVDKAGDTFRDASDFDVRDTSLKLAFPLSPSTLLTVNAARWHDEHELPGRLTADELDADREQNPNHPDADWVGWAYSFDAKVRHQFCDDSWFAVQTYYRKSQRSLKSTRPGSRPPFTAIRDASSDSHNAGIEATGEFAFDLGTRHVINWGVRHHEEWVGRNISDERLGSGSISTSLHTEHELEANSIHVDDTVELGDLTLNAGLRHERIPHYHGEDAVSGGERDFDFSDTFGGVSASYALTKYLAAFGNYHQTFRTPQTFSFDFTARPQDMSFEHGDMREAGLRVENFNGISGSAVLWASRYSNFILFDDLTQVEHNLGRYAMQGLDLTAEFDMSHASSQLAGWTVFHSQTWADSRFRSGAFDGNDVPHVASVTCKGGVRYAPGGTGFYGSLEYNFRSKCDAVPENTAQTPSYTLWDARVGWRNRIVDNGDGGGVDLDVGIGVKNLFDRQYHLRHDADRFVPGRPREFFLDVGLRWVF